MATPDWYRGSVRQLLEEAPSSHPDSSKLFVTTTHCDPGHAGGEGGYPPGTILIRDPVQERETEAHEKEMMDLFTGHSTGLLRSNSGRTLDRDCEVSTRFFWQARSVNHPLCPTPLGL